MLEREGEREYTITREEERKRELTSRERRHDFQRLMLDDEMGVKMGEGYFEWQNKWQRLLKPRIQENQNQKNQKKTTKNMIEKKPSKKIL